MLVLTAYLNKDESILVKYLLAETSLRPLHTVCWCPRTKDALNAARCLLFDDFDSSSKVEERNFIHFSDHKSQFARIDRSMVTKFDPLRMCMIRRLLSVVDDDGETVLHTASKLGNRALVEYLLMKAREVWLWPNIARFVVTKYFFKHKKPSDRIGDVISKELKEVTRKNFERDLDFLGLMFTEWKTRTVKFLSEYDTTFTYKKGVKKVDRNKVVREYAMFVQDKYTELLHARYHKNKKTSEVEDAKMIVESLKRRDCSEYLDSRSELFSLADRFDSTCCACGHGHLSFNPYIFDMLSRKNAEIQREITLSGIKPFSSYLEFVLHPIVPFEKKNFKRSKTETDPCTVQIVRNLRRCALYTATHFGEWDVVGCLTEALLGDAVVLKTDRKKLKNGKLLASSIMASELGNACVEHSEYMRTMVPELASFCGPCPDDKPSEGSDPTDITAMENFQSQKKKWIERLELLCDIYDRFKKLVQRPTSNKSRSSSFTEKVNGVDDSMTSSDLIDFNLHKTNDSLRRLKKRLDANKYHCKFSKTEIRKMLDGCKKAKAEVAQDLMLYEEEGMCIGCFSCLGIGGSSAEYSMRSTKANDADYEKLKRWRYAECSRRVSKLQ